MEFQDIRVFEEVVKQLMSLPEEERAKVYRWVGEKCDLRVVGAASGSKGSRASGGSEGGDEAGEAEGIESFDSVADLLGAVDAKIDQDRALVVASYLGKKNGSEQLSGKQINDELKNLGVGAKNITDVISQLMRKKPALMMQTSKTGQSRQGRKTYKVTVPGYAKVEAMVEKGFKDEGEG